MHSSYQRFEISRARGTRHTSVIKEVQKWNETTPSLGLGNKASQGNLAHAQTQQSDPLSHWTTSCSTSGALGELEGKFSMILSRKSSYPNQDSYPASFWWSSSSKLEKMKTKKNLHWTLWKATLNAIITKRQNNRGTIFAFERASYTKNHQLPLGFLCVCWLDLRKCVWK